MTQLRPIALDSYDLAAYAVEVPCFVCDGGNNFDSDRCRHCQAPLALTYQAENNSKHPPSTVAILGPAASGKTVYLGMLSDVLSRQAGPFQFLARGAFSLEVQQHSIAGLSQRRFPPATHRDPENWNWMHCQVNDRSRRRPLELILPDMSGAAIEEEVDHHASPIIREFLKRCAAAIILVDAERLAHDDQSPDFFAMKVISHLHELGASRKASWTRRPVAIVFTKADGAPGCFEDPAAYAEVHAPGLWRQCNERLKKHAFFATSVIGAHAAVNVNGNRVPVAMRVEPRGVVDPLQWLVKQLG